MILDGQKKAGNGIEIYKANNVWVENLTVRNFDTGTESEACNNKKEGEEQGCGNEIWWNGGAPSNKIGAHGWYGSYLTAYDTGLNGSYGIFTGHETKGSWTNIYASGFNDSGMYVGACQECEATITGAVMENNSLGYSGSNSGGQLLIENSVFRNNSVGVVPNSEAPATNLRRRMGMQPTRTTKHAHTDHHLDQNRAVYEDPQQPDTANNNLSVPVNASTARGAVGTGVILASTYADLVENNVISNNSNTGLFGIELPVDGIFFQLAGNRISNNVFAHNGYHGGPFTGDLRSRAAPLKRSTGRPSKRPRTTA